MEKDSKKIIIIVAVVVFCIFAMVGAFFGLKAYNRNKLVKNAEKYVELKNYDDAIITYNKLILKSDKPEYTERLETIKKLKDSNENFIEGEKSFKKEKFKEAYNHLKEVIKDDKDNYKSAKKMLEEIDAKFISAIEASIEDMNFEDAETKIAEYKELFNNSDKVLAFKEKILDAKDKQEKEVKEQEELALAKDELEKLKKEVENKKSSTSNKNKVAKSGDYGTFYVTSAKANVRSGPDVNASVITYVSQGSSVYIYETVEDVGRTWCHAIITSSVTGNSYDGWISSRNLDYSL
ncbi:SH3 domain-containing protein [Miniphocaeibacter massiliensis]|uniref:SH3 domain-containing protein n=1 Tax=Miniphocaeibacter massiliensis TaxID=2041841 RepID=UPI000C1BD02D|nr:SH3 domain-containing protein [Miniphocaeibacter massiliensis]